MSEILGAAADEELAVGLVGEVVGAEPAAAEGLLRRAGVAEVAGGDARPAQPDLADLALAEGRSPAPMTASSWPGKGRPQETKLHRRALVRGARLARAHGGEIDAVGAEGRGDVGEGDRQRRFGHAVRGEDALGAGPLRGEAAEEGAQDLGLIGSAPQPRARMQERSQLRACPR